MHHEDNPACSGLHAPRTTIEIRKVRMRFGFRPQTAAPGRFVGLWAVALGLMLTGVAGALEDRDPNKREAGTPTPASRRVSAPVEARLQEDVSYLAADAREGRAPGTK